MMKKLSSAKLELRYQKRKEVVDAVRRGEFPSLVARVFNIPIRTVFQWLALFRQGSYDALRDEHRSGRPRKVTAEVMHWLYEVITMGSPQQHKFEFCLWTLAIIRTMLKRKKGIELSKSGVSRLLRQLGLSPQIPVYRSYRQDPKEVEKYLTQTFPELRALAKRTGAIIYFVDEASVRSDHHRGTTWGKIGETPVVNDSGNRFGLRLISAVSPRGDMKFATFSGQMNGARFVQFLKDLRADAGKPVIVIMDNARYHRGKEVKEFVEANEGQVMVDICLVTRLSITPMSRCGTLPSLVWASSSSLPGTSLLRKFVPSCAHYNRPRRLSDHSSIWMVRSMRVTPAEYLSLSLDMRELLQRSIR